MRAQSLSVIAAGILGMIVMGTQAQAEEAPPSMPAQPPASGAVVPPTVPPAVNKTQKREAIIDAREANQQKRIEQGIKSGELNAKEAAHLEKREEHIEKMEEKAKADGVVTKKEMKRIDAAQDRASRKIFNKKHNGRRG